MRGRVLHTYTHTHTLRSRQLRRLKPRKGLWMSGKQRARSGAAPLARARRRKMRYPSCCSYCAGARRMEARGAAACPQPRRPLPLRCSYYVGWGPRCERSGGLRQLACRRALGRGRPPVAGGAAGSRQGTNEGGRAFESLGCMQFEAGGEERGRAGAANWAASQAGAGKAARGRARGRACQCCVQGGALG
jgi:hypothetical protein